MVTTITRYACDICGERHPSADLASACEERGIIDELSLTPGTFVAVGVHGWWDDRRAWVLTMPQQADPRPHMQGKREHHGPAAGRESEWAYDPDRAQLNDVGRNWWNPVWRVLGTVPADHDAHLLRTVLWTPEHANGPREKLRWTITPGHHRPMILGDDMAPAMTTAQEERFTALRAELVASPVKFARKVSLL